MNADQAIASVLGFLAERTIRASEMEVNRCSLADCWPFNTKAERDHLASRINSQYVRKLRLIGVQSTAHQDVEGDVDRNVVHSDQHFTRTGLGGLDVLWFEDLGTTKLTQYDRLHVSLLLGRLFKRLNPARRMLVKHAALHDRE